MDTEFYKHNLHNEVTGKQINDKTHDVFMYKIGLNDKIRQNEFYTANEKDEFHITNEKDGFHITSENNIYKYLEHGKYVANVKIPDDAKCYLGYDKIKCDKIILESMKLIKDFVDWNDIDFCLKAVKKNGSLIEHMSEEMLANNIDICLEAVKNNGYSIKHIAKKILANNIDICLEAVKQNGYSFEYIDKEILANNINICLEAVKQNGYLIDHIDKEILANNINICLEAAKQNGPSIN
jgi:hypothetical protein